MILMSGKGGSELEDYIKKSYKRLITTVHNPIGIINIDRQQKLGNKNGKKNNSTDISSDKLTRLLMDMATKGTSLREKQSLF